MKTRQEIKALARDAMRAQRGTAILLVFVLMLVSVASGILDMIVMNAFGMGVLYYIVYWVGMAIIMVMGVNALGEYIKIWQRQDASTSALFSELKVNFWRKLGGVMWQMLWTILWSLLLIVPGIIKSMSYYFTPNILVDCPDVKATDAIKISMRITEGHKMDVFIFILSWIGWFILSLFTFGILLIVYVGPYFYTADAGFYIELRNKALREGRITPEELGKTAAELGLSSSY